MAVGEPSIQQAFGQAWDVLPQPMQDAYEGALEVQQARILLAAAALFGAMNDGVVGEAQVQTLEGRLQGLHLSQLEKLGDAVEDVAAQLGLPPYAVAETGAAVLSLISTQVEAEPASSGSEKDSVTDGISPESSSEISLDSDNGPEKLPETPSGQPASEVTNSSSQEASEPQPEIDERPVTDLEKQEFIKIFGMNEHKRIARLTRQQADTVITKLSHILTGSSASTAPRHVQLWRRHLDGLSDDEIAREDGGGLMQSTVKQYRSNVRLAIRRTKPSLDVLLGQEVAAASEPTSEEREQTIVIQQLTEQLDILASSLHMSDRQKRALKQRLDEYNELVGLTPDAREALSALEAKYRRLTTWGKLELKGLEKSLFEEVIGVNEDHTTYPLPSVVGMMGEELASAKVTPTQLLASVIQKMNEASGDITQSA